MSQKPFVPEQEQHKPSAYAAGPKELTQTQALLKDAQKAAERSRAESKLLKKQKKEAQEQLCHMKRERVETLRLLQESKKETAAAQANLKRIQDDYIQLSQQYQSLLHSDSIRLTAPLRALGQGFRRMLGAAARAGFTLYKRVKRCRRTKIDCRALPGAKKQYQHESCAIKSGTVSRLGIYFIYDQDGIVDDYVLVFLRAFAACVKRMLIVCNGTLTPESRARLGEITPEILIRDNKGFDSWAYKEAMETVGYNNLATYDEVILTNFTIMGPVSPLETMFEKMDPKDLDFWGISSHPGLDFDPFHCCPYHRVPEHLQFYFIAFRQPMLQSDLFQSYWENLPPIKTYNEAVGLHEAVFTKYFADRGFVWDSYLDHDAYYPITDNPMVCAPVWMMETMHCPVFKRRVFFQDYDYLISNTAGQTAIGLLRYLEEKTSFDTGLLWSNLLRTCHMSDLRETLHLLRVLPASLSRGESVSRKQKKSVALIMHLYNTEMADQLASYVQNMPDGADIYISTTSENKKTTIIKAFSKAGLSPDVRVFPNRGRDVSVLLAGFNNVWPAYDYICVTHDKKTGHLKPATVGEGFAYIGYENILSSKDYVQNILDTFNREPCLGILAAPAPNHSDFITHIGMEWGKNFSAARALADELKIQVPMDEDHPPCAPIGSNFWARTKALEPLLQKSWTYQDFPAEPLQATDGTIMHAVERIYPYAAQQAGYYVSLLMTDDYYATEKGNMEFYAQGYTRTLFREHLGGLYITVLDRLQSVLAMKNNLRYRFRGKLKSTIFKWMEW